MWNNVRWSLNPFTTGRVFENVPREPENTPMLFTKFCCNTSDGKIRFSISFLVSFESSSQEDFFGHKECFIQPYFPRAFSRWKNARRVSHVYIRGWAHRGTTENMYIYVIGGERVKLTVQFLHLLCYWCSKWSPYTGWLLNFCTYFVIGAPYMLTGKNRDAKRCERCERCSCKDFPTGVKILVENFVKGVVNKC